MSKVTNSPRCILGTNLVQGEVKYFNKLIKQSLVSLFLLIWYERKVTTDSLKGITSDVVRRLVSKGKTTEIN